MAAWVNLATIAVALGLLVGSTAGGGAAARRAPRHFAVVACVASFVAWLAPHVATPLPGETSLLRATLVGAARTDFGGPMPAATALAGMSALALLGLVPRRGRRAYAARWLAPLATGGAA
ncbi:MAG: hypothetical protein KIT14_21655, partial [bacterium]|nr:hypothetical protein [bacterium]